MSRSLLARVRTLLLGAAFAAGALCADPVSHPTRDDRLVATIDDVEVEYSTGYEQYVQPFAEAISAWRKERALEEIATRERHGEDLLPRLWQEIGRTPHAKVSMKIAAKAFLKLTRARPDQLARDAAKRPLSAPRPPTVAQEASSDFRS